MSIVKKPKIPKVDPAQVVRFIMTTDGKKLSVQGKRLNDQELSQLRGEISQFKSTRLYKILFETLKEEGMDIIMNKSKDFQDVLNGKMILHVCGTMENIMAKLE